MLILLFILTVAALIVTLVMTNMAKKKNTGSLYKILSAIQGACLGGNFGILAVLLVLGRTLS